MLRMDDMSGAALWLTRLSLVSNGNRETSLLRVRLARREGKLKDFNAAFSAAEDYGVSGLDLERERILFAAQMGEMRRAGPHLSRLLTDPEVDQREVCLAYVGGYLRVHRTGEAMTIIDAWSKDVPTDPYPWIIRGRIHRIQIDLPAAELDFQEALKRSPGAIEAVVELAEVLLESRRPREAIQLLESSEVKLDGFRLRSQLCMAAALKAAGFGDRSFALLKQTVAEFPQEVSGWLEAGRSELENGEFAGAAKSLEQAVSLQPSNDEVHFLLGQALRGCGRNEEADQHFAFVNEAREVQSELNTLLDQIRKNPQDPALLVAAGRLMLKYSKPEEGVITLLAAIDIDENNADAHGLLAEYYESRTSRDPEAAELAQWHRRKSTGSK